MKKKIADFIDRQPFPTVLILSFLMNIIISCLHSRSLFTGISLIFCHPISALYNLCILVTFYSIALFFRRRCFVLFLVSVFWFALGITDCVLLGMRVTPLQAIDFYIFRTGISIIDVYMTVPQILLCVLGILVAVALLVVFFIQSPRSEPHFLQALLILIAVLLVLVLFSLAFIGLGNADPGNYDDISDAYNAYGFPYCFLRSVFDRGIPEPEDYSEKTIKELLADLATDKPSTPSSKPNFIFVQLESFFDVTRLSNVVCSEDPIPNFRALKKDGISGLFRVPSIGAGTANTEFEVLSGLDIGFFGTGEYPYQSILKTRPCETVAYDLAAMGYGTHAFHNHTATFYDRYRVYANLGFDDFTGAEHMKNLTYNSLGWEKDENLLSYIEKALNSTPQSDFVFAVTVEGHGSYPELPTGDEDSIRVMGIADEALLNSYEYYVNTLRSTDAFLGELVKLLSTRKEETVLVLWGDHLPSLAIAEEDLSSGTLLQTDYVIWSNRGLPCQTPATADIPAYSLYAEVLRIYGIENGLIPRLYNRYRQDPNYSDMLKLVGYDSLYGDRLAYGDSFPYKTRNLKMGIDEIVINSVSVPSSNEFFVLGKNFTPASRVFLNGKQLKTVYVSEETLYVEDEKIRAGDVLSVAQISVDLRKLSETAPFSIPENEILPK